MRLALDSVESREISASASGPKVRRPWLQVAGYVPGARSPLARGLVGKRETRTSDRSSVGVARRRQSGRAREERVARASAAVAHTIEYQPAGWQGSREQSPVRRGTPRESVRRLFVRTCVRTSVVGSPFRQKQQSWSCVRSFVRSFVRSVSGVSSACLCYFGRHLPPGRGHRLSLCGVDQATSLSSFSLSLSLSLSPPSSPLSLVCVCAD